MANILRVRTTLNYGAGGPGLMTNYFGNEQRAYNLDAAQVAVDRIRDSLLAGAGIFSTAQSWVVSGEVDQLNDVDGVVNAQYGALQRTGAGTTNVALGPLPVGMLLRLKTAVFIQGRRLVGRQFFVPIQSFETVFPAPRASAMAIVQSYGTSLLDAGLTTLLPYVWSRPRPATPVGPKAPAGPARLFRAGSSAPVTTTSVSPEWAVLTSRRD